MRLAKVVLLFLSSLSSSLGILEARCTIVLLLVLLLLLLILLLVVAVVWPLWEGLLPVAVFFVVGGTGKGLMIVSMAICRGSGVVALDEDADEVGEVNVTALVWGLELGIVGGFPLVVASSAGIVVVVMVLVVLEEETLVDLAKSEHALWFLMTVLRIPRAMYSTRVWISCS